MFRIIFWLVLLSNYFAINYCVFIGMQFEDVSFLFQENQAITFLSALQLAITSLLALLIYVLGKIIYKKNIERLKTIRVWILSSVIFAFSVLDEYFMIHEGVDGSIATLFFGIKENPHLDGLTLSLYGIVALIIFFRFRQEILRYKKAFRLFCVGAFFFLLTIALDIKSVDSFRVVLEESSKLIAVSFLLLGHIRVFMENLKSLDRQINN